MNENNKKYILFFDQITDSTMARVGGKNGSLGRMISNLGNQVRIPAGFAVTADAYWVYMQENKLEELLQENMAALTDGNQQELHDAAERMRTAILAGKIPDDVRDALEKAYSVLNCSVAVRSSATAEDLPTASFAGQHDSFLHVQGIEAVCEAYKKCLASLFNERAVVYRNEHTFRHDAVALSVGIQKMVRSDTACSGVLFTIDTETGFADAIVINASYGLGEAIVQGRVNPDEYMVHKVTFKQGFPAIIKKTNR